MLLHHDREIARDTMAFSLWPDVSEDEARANLRRALYLLQRWLPDQSEPWFFANRRYVQWNAGARYTFDVETYESFEQQGRLADAAALYTGDLLDGVEDEWIVAERERLRNKQLDVLRRLTGQLRDSGDVAGAIAAAQQALVIDPWQESFVRELIQLRALSGDRAAAIREYRSFEDALRREMNAAPERETTEVLERVTSGDQNDALPPLASRAFTSNLPAQLTRLIGREEEVGNLKSFLDRHRLVTIVGAGGIGKTRLAVAVGAQITDRYRDGVWFIEFAPVSVPAFIPGTVAAALHIQESHERTLTESVIQALSSRRALLIFDNCEHLVDAMAHFADDVLRACPKVQIVATSRQPLNTQGEQVYRVQPLTFPQASAGLSATEAMEYSAISLFVERAQAVRNSFTLTDQNVTAVADICRRLDGIALAVELAAARVRVLSPSSVNDGLRARFRLLTGGTRTQLPRHQTLRALFDWSYELLDEREKLLLRRVAVFAGSFSLDGAVATADGLGLDEVEILDILTSLVEKSLVNAETTAEIERYHILESTRQYLDERLQECGERDNMLRLHAEYYRAFAERSDREFHRTPQSKWFHSVAAEYENVREALLWAIAGRNDAAIGAQIAGSLEHFWFDYGRIREGLFWIEQAVETIDENTNPALGGRLHLARAVLLWGTNKLRAADRACELYEMAGDSRGVGYALRQRALTLRQQHPDEAEAACRRAVELLESAGDSGGFAIALNTLGSIVAKRGDFDEARAAHEHALEVATGCACEYALLITLIYLADNEFRRGNAAEAVARLGQALERADATRMPRLVLNVRSNLATYRIALGQYAEAVTDILQAIAFLPNVQDGYSTAVVLQQAALIEAERGNVSQAARLTGYVDAYFASNDTEREATEKIGRERLEKALRARLSDAAYNTLLKAGSALSEEQAVEEARGVRQVAA
jgi:predicted ATPase/DNA-binding SARP family transcriptional activator/predicted negative regulator of RcsB-dependent stress response